MINKKIVDRLKNKQNILNKYKSIWIGMIIGGLYVFVSIIVFLIIKNIHMPQLIQHFLNALLMPFFILLMIIGDNNPSPYTFLPIIILIFVTIGAFIGLSINLLKKKKNILSWIIIILGIILILSLIIYIIFILFFLLGGGKIM